MRPLDSALDLGFLLSGKAAIVKKPSTVLYSRQSKVKISPSVSRGPEVSSCSKIDVEIAIPPSQKHGSQRTGYKSKNLCES